jgi:hypothetical protein
MAVYFSFIEELEMLPYEWHGHISHLPKVAILVSVEICAKVSTGPCILQSEVVEL